MSGTDTRWSSVAERGSLAGLRFIVWCYLGLGRRFSGWLLYPVAAYFVLAAGPARRASRRYLERMHAQGGGDERPGFGEVFSHFLTFAEMTLDRACFWAGRYDSFSLHLRGIDVVNKHLDEGRGVVMLGAHLGSFDVLRVMARDHKVRVNAVMFTDNAEHINAIFKGLDPSSDVHVIQMDPASIRSAFEIKSCLERGEVLALLGDRAAPGGRGRTTSIPFLGGNVTLPEGPFLLPLLFGSPVFLSLAIRNSARSYELHFEQLSDRGRVPATARPEALEELMTIFAQRLEHYATQAPLQWFNFYDYWAEGIESES